MSRGGEGCHPLHGDDVAVAAQTAPAFDSKAIAGGGPAHAAAGVQPRDRVVARHVRVKVGAVGDLGECELDALLVRVGDRLHLRRIRRIRRHLLGGRLLGVVRPYLEAGSLGQDEVRVDGTVGAEAAGEPRLEQHEREVALVGQDERAVEDA